MPRSFWKGTISFGLVSIPIQLHTAIKKHLIGFRLLHERCGNPIISKRWCQHCEEEVEWSNVLKGLKLKNGSFFLLDQENLKKLKPIKTDTIIITEFVHSSQIYSLYLNEHYYAAPQKQDDRAYGLFCKALKKAKLVAVGKLVMKDKEHVCILEPYGSILVLSTLNYAYEIQDDSEIIDSVKLSKTDEKELALASLLIEKLYNKEFNLAKYKDSFAQKILKALSSSKGKNILPKAEKPKKTKNDSEQSLVALLKKSIA